MDKAGRYAFIAGFAIAVFAGLGFQASWVAWVLAALGVIVGFLNVTGRETRGFLIASIALILSASSVQAIDPGEFTRVGYSIVANVVTFMSAAVLVVALKSVFEVTKS